MQVKGDRLCVLVNANLLKILLMLTYFGCYNGNK